MGLPNNISPLQNGGSPFYTVNRSLRFRSSASAYLNRTPASAGNRKTWTWSGWIKLGALTSGFSFITQYTDSNNQSQARIRADGVLRFYDLVGGSFTTDIYWTPVYRDPSAWYHIMLVADTTQATNTNRIKFYVNSVQITSTSSATWPALNTDLRINLNAAHFIGQNGAGGEYADGYLAEVNFIDGQQLTPSSFGSYDTNGIWQPLKYTGSYGTNGFYLPFNNGASTTTLGYDASGNSNNWTTNNISLTAGTTYDWMQDVPTNNSSSAANFAVLNPLNNSRGITISNANLKGAWGSASDSSILGTISIPSSGKFYAELTNDTLTSASVAVSFGLGTAESSRSAMVAANMWVYYASNQSYIVRSGTFSSQIGSNQTIAANGILQVAIDRDNNQAWLGYNNVWVNATNGTDGNPSAGTNPTVSSLPANLFILCGWYANSGSVNFGQRPFSYTPPTGFNALNTANLPTPLISNGAQYMAATTWTGDGTSTRSISNGGNNTIGTTFQPDFVWSKVRSTTYGHNLFDVVRGAGSLKELNTNSTNAEGGNQSNVYGYLSAFNSNGFSVTAGTDASIPSAYWNQSSATYVAWQWKGGGTAVTNTSGSITSSVSANPSAGFSVVTYTGTAANATVGHGLGVAPNMIITKNRDSSTDWWVYHSSLGATQYVVLNTTAAAVTSSNAWNNTSPTSTVFSLGSGSPSNANRDVAYCFAAVSSYSAFGSYTGNGSSDGPFIYTGFRPRFLMIKRATGTPSNWYIWDFSRSPFNAAVAELYPNSSNAEANGSNDFDFLSNGFKTRNTADAGINGNGETFVYACFSENPFSIARAR